MEFGYRTTFRNTNIYTYILRLCIAMYIMLQDLHFKIRNQMNYKLRIMEILYSIPKAYNLIQLSNSNKMIA